LIVQAFCYLQARNHIQLIQKKKRKKTKKKQRNRSPVSNAVYDVSLSASGLAANTHREEQLATPLLGNRRLPIAKSWGGDDAFG